MRFTPRQLMLPAIVALSLTGVSLGILYLLIEKDKENSQTDRSTTGRRFGGSLTLEMQVPKEFVPVLIGRGGTVIKKMESSTGTRINFSDDEPETSYRMCHIRGSAEGLKMAEAMITNMIASQPLIETYETYIAQRFCPKIIGTAGETINQIQSSSKAKVIIEKVFSRDPNSKRRLIIKGTAEQIASALVQIEDKVQEYSETLDKLVAGESTRSPRAKISLRAPSVELPVDTPLLTPPADEETANEGTMEVYVSAVENPSQFWVQVAGPGTLSLDDLIAEMTTYYENEENRELHVLKNITVGQTVAAKFLFDGKWYRAEVYSVHKDGEFVVYFLDYGDREIVGSKYILELRTDFLSLRTQAIECTLANVKPRNGEWSAEATDRFDDLVWVAQWKVLTAKVRGYKERALGCGISRREGSPIPCVDLYDRNETQEINIGKQLVAENFAEADEGAWSAASSTLSLSRRDKLRSPTPVRSPPQSSNTTTITPPPPPKTTKTPKVIEEVDLRTPMKSTGPIEEVDLVTPVKTVTRKLIEHEKSELAENGRIDDDQKQENGDHGKENGKADVSRTNFIPGGYESDESDNSDLSLG